MKLWIPGWLPPGLNGPEGLLRRHYRKRAGDKKKIAERVRLTGVWTHTEWVTPLLVVREAIPDPCRVIWTRYGPRLMDFTNAAASFKNLEDVLVDIGVLIDDSPGHVAELVVRQVKVPKAKQGCSVEFLPL